MIGLTISHYRIIEKLGEGGMGVVYKAEDLKLKRIVALKFLPSSIMASEAEKRRFVHEARAAAALNHPNVCTIYEIEEVEGQSFMAMEFIEGQSLKAKIEAGPLKLEEALNIAIQVAEGLQAAHEKKITHRDIKPANIMLTSKGQVKIMDFGLAKLAGRTVLTKEGSTLGTVNYMSPEQTRGEEVDHRTDIWSLGVVLYEMITGRSPFKGDYDQAVVYSIMNEDPEPLTALRTDVPIELEPVVTKCLAKNLQERYQHVDELKVDLRAVCKHQESTKTKSYQSPKTKKRTKYSFVILTIVALIILFILGRIFLFTDHADIIDSIAILPFENVEDNPDLEYLCNGIADEIIYSLSRLPNLKVISSTSVRHYKGKEIDPQHLSRELNVRAILVGRLLQPGNNVSIWVELIDTKDERQLWGEQYLREFTELFEIEKDISREISENLRLKLTAQEKGKLVRTYTRSNDAYQAYLKGLYHWNKFTIDGFTKAINYYTEALEIDPEYALAHAGLSNCYASLGSYHGYLAPADIFPKARAEALKAIELDHELGEAYLSLGTIKWYYDWDWTGAEQAFHRTVELNPNSALAHQHYGVFLSAMGRTVEAIIEEKQALALDPLSYKINDDLALSYVDLHQYDNAMRQVQIAIELDPQLPSAHRSLGLIYYLQGQNKKAIEEFRKAAELSGVQKRYLAYLGWILGMTGNKAQAREILYKLKKKPNAEGCIALVYIGLGDKDQAFEWLNKAFQVRSSMMVLIKVDPYYNSIRSDPRFKDLLDKMDFRE